MEVLKSCEGCDILPYPQWKKLAPCKDAGRRHQTPEQRQVTFLPMAQRATWVSVLHPFSLLLRSHRDDAEWMLYTPWLRNPKPEEIKSFTVVFKNPCLTFVWGRGGRYYLYYARRYTNPFSALEGDSRKIKPSVPLEACKKGSNMRNPWKIGS